MTLTYSNCNGKYTTVKEVLVNEFNMSKRLILKLKRNNRISLTSLEIGSILNINLDFQEDNSNIVPMKMKFNIIYEDEAYLIVNKPAGIAIHPSCNHYDTSLSNAVRLYFDEIGLKRKIRPVNRLDKDTSGIVIFAKNEYIQECLVKQMKQNVFIKEYIGVLDGILENKARYN